VLGEARAPVVLRRLLDGRAVELAAVAHAKVDAQAVELRLVGKGARGGAVAGRGGVRGPPGVGRELYNDIVQLISISLSSVTSHGRL
jgi:hypothetical protein